MFGFTPLPSTMPTLIRIAFHTKWHDTGFSWLWMPTTLRKRLTSQRVSKTRLLERTNKTSHGTGSRTVTANLRIDRRRQCTRSAGTPKSIEECRRMIYKIFATDSDTATSIVRLMLGIIFFAHGAQKLLGWFG